MPLLDKKKAALHIGICTDTLMDEVHAGRLIGFKIGGRWRFDPRDLDKYIDDKRQEAVMAADVRQNQRQKKGNVVPIKQQKSAGGSAPLVKYWKPGMRIDDVCGLSQSKGR